MLPCVRKVVLGIPLITNAGLYSTWLTLRCQSRHQRQQGTQSWLCVSRQRRTQSVNPTLWIDWWEASFGNTGSFGGKIWAWVYGLLNVCNTYWTDGLVGLTVGHLVLVENFNSHKIGKNCCSNSQCLFYRCIHILITFICIANMMFSSLTDRTSLCTHVLYQRHNAPVLLRQFWITCSSSDKRKMTWRHEEKKTFFNSKII